MRKILSLLVVMACVAMFSSAVFASTTTFKTVNATANFASSGDVYVSFDLKNVVGDTTATEIAWDVSSVQLGTTTLQWKTASTYAVLTSSVTIAGGAVYMYQDNTQAASPYTATTPRTSGTANDKVYSGLVRSGSGGGEVRGYIPLSYTMSVSKLSSGYEYVVSSGTARYFVDKEDKASDGITSAFDSRYATLTNTDGIIANVDGSGVPYALEGVSGHTAYMYFGAGFSNILGGDVYGTTKILVVKWIE